MANVTGTYRGASASVTVTISDSGSAQTMQITDFGDIVFEFDITPDQPQIDRIIAMYSTVSVSVFQYDNFGNDLFDRFSTGATRSVLITIAFYNGETAYFRYELTNQSVTVNDLQKIVTLKLQPYRLPTTMGEFFANISYTDDILTYRRNRADGTIITYNAVAPGRFIKRILGELVPQTAVQFESNDYLVGSGMTQFVFQDFDKTNTTALANQNCFVLVNIVNSLGFPDVTLTNGTNVAPENTPAYQVMLELAAAEGCMIGTGWSGFYRPRINTASTTINYSDLTDLAFVQGFNAIQYTFMNINKPSYVSTGSDRQLPAYEYGYLGPVAYNPSATKFARFEFQPGFPFLSTGQIQIGATNVNGQIRPTSTNSTVELAFAGLNNYANAFGAPDGTYFISGTIKGLSKLKPYEAIAFGSDVPARYQSRTFRPTFLSYSVKSDLIRFKAYQI